MPPEVNNGYVYFLIDVLQYGLLMARQDGQQASIHFFSQFVEVSKLLQADGIALSQVQMSKQQQSLRLRC